MQAKLLILFLLVAGSIVAPSIVASTVGQAPIGRKREVHLYFVSQLRSPVVFFFFRELELPKEECLLFLVRHDVHFD